MKKKTMLVLLALCLFVTVAAAAVIHTLPDNSGTEEMPAQENIYLAYDKEPAYQDIQPLEGEEQAIFEKINKSGLSKDEIYDKLFTYLHFIKLYHPSDAEIQYLNSYIEKGADIDVLMDIYSFWKTTAEDISIIGQIYEQSGFVDDPYWIEEVFNQITENRHGVLDVEAINQYEEQGITKKDIAAANVLCRKGIYTIEQILEKLLAGESWSDIIVQTNANGGAEEQILEQSGLLEEPVKLLAYIQMAQLMQKDPAIYLSDVNGIDTLNAEMQKYNNEIIRQVYNELASHGIYKEDEQNAAAVENIYEDIKSNGVSEAEINALKEDGYDELEILNASEENKMLQSGVREILESQATDESNGEEAGVQ